MNLLGLKNNNRLTLSKLNAQIRKLATQKTIPLTIVQTHSESKAVSIIHKKRRNYSHIILCPEIINREAKKYGFTPNFRWAHMIVHSMLHLQGYNHVTKRERLFMEKTEVKLLNSMNFGNPYVRS